MLKKISAELILMSMFLPWAIWVTVSIFAGETAQAVLVSKYDTILETVKEAKQEAKEGFKEIKEAIKHLGPK